MIGATLVHAARISGIELERVPRNFVGDGELVTTFGHAGAENDTA